MVLRALETLREVIMKNVLVLFSATGLFLASAGAAPAAAVQQRSDLLDMDTSLEVGLGCAEKPQNLSGRQLHPLHAR